MCGYSSTYIGKIERGQRSPSLDTLIRIAEALQIPIASLFDPFYRQREEMKGESNPSDFSPYDAVLRRFNYLVGSLNGNGKVEYVNHLPWFQSELRERNYSGYVFWELPFLSFSSNLQDEVQQAIEHDNFDEPVHFSLSIVGFDFFGESTDLVLVPQNKASNDADVLRFELFYPRVVRDGESVSLEDLQFELSE